MSACPAGYGDHVDADVALAFADGTLSPPERTEVERRIDACAACREAVAAAARETAGVTKRERPVSAEVHRSVQLVAGDVVGRYIVERPIGAGGMGVVSLARDPELRRAVVIKLVRPDAADDDLEARLRREAQAMAQLSHANVVQIFDIGRHGDRVFLAMEFIAGQTLDAWLIERERSVAEILAMFAQAGAGLEAAHRAGLLHRDFKPANVLVDRDGVAKVTDFGLARALGAPGTPVAVQPRMSGVHAVLTHVDAVIGTPAYMAPEQAAGEPLDGRTDQYALALALLDALVGQQPSRRTIKPSQPAAEIEAALAKVPARPRAAIVRALHLQPAERWPDLAAFLRELAPARRERRWWPLVAAGAIAIAGVTTVLALRREPRVTGCLAEAPRAWAQTRASVVDKLASRPRVFAAWHAAHVAEAIDRAVADIGAAEVARCQGTSIDVPCLDRKRAALAAIDGMAPDNPWLSVRSLASCTPPAPATGEPATLRAELFTADATRARAIAERARELDDDLLRADALDLAGNLALAAGALDEAGTDFVTAASVGEKAGDDALRGRALLGLLDLARVRGDHAAARDHVRQLGGMLDKHGNAAPDVFPVAIASADAFMELGDVEGAFAALDRAAATAKSPDEQLRAQVAHAWAMWILRWNPEEAKREIDAAIAGGTAASPPTRAAAWTVAADLAFARKDASAARQATYQVTTSGKTLALPDRLRGLRTRALYGDVVGVLEDLEAPIDDPTMAARVKITRAHVHLEGGNPHAAINETEGLIRELRSPAGTARHIGLTAFERAEIYFLRCDAQLAAELRVTSCTRPPPLEKVHPRAPLLARWHLQMAADYEKTIPGIVSGPLAHAVDILAEAGAKPLLVAELRLRLVRIETSRTDRKRHAEAARVVFAAAGRTAEVAELDAVIAELGSRWTPPADAGVAAPPDAGVDAAPRDASGDPWAP